jgi:hypothetical protein
MSTLEPNMFTPAAIAGKAALVPDPGNLFFTQVINQMGAQTDLAVSPAVGEPGAVFAISIALPDAATTTYSYISSSKIEIIDVICRKQTAGAGNTVQIKDGAGNAISDAMATAVDKTITRAGTLDIAFNPKAGITTFQITATRAAGVMTCDVTLLVRRR